MRRCFPLFVLLLFLHPVPAYPDINPLGHWAEGPAVGIAKEDDTVYLSRGGLIEILDVSDPFLPAPVSRYTIGSFIVDMDVSGGILYAYCETRGLHILDVSDPFDVQPLAFLEIEGHVQQMEISGDRLYFSSSNSASLFEVVDISDPAAPTVTDIPVDGAVLAFAIDGFHAYLSQGNIRVLDLTDPTAPLLLSEIPYVPGNYFSHLAVDDHRLHAVAHSYFGHHSLRVYDISDPAAPIEMGFTTEGSQIFDLAINGPRAYCSFEDSLAVFDVSDPATMDLCGQSPLLDHSIHMVNDGDYVYLAEPDYGLQIFRGVEDGACVDPVETGRHNRGFYGAVTDVCRSGEYLYASSTAPTLTIYDAAGTVEPTVIGTLNEHVPGTEDTRGYSVAVHDGYAYVRSVRNDFSSLLVIDVSVPDSPTAVAMIGGALFNIQFNGSTGYVHSTSPGYSIRAFDFGDPTDPEQIASLPLADAARHGVDGDLLLVAVGDDFRAYDIGDPSAITELGRVDLGWSPDMRLPLEMHCGGGRATIVDALGGWHPDGMRVVDYSDPAAMVVHAAAGPGDRALAIVSDGRHLYMSLGESGIETFSLADPDAPVLDAGFETGYWTFGLSGDATKLFIADSYDGIMIVENDAGFSGVDRPPSPVAGRLWNHPNPFNPQTTVSFDLPMRQAVSLDILDLSGHMVRNLADRSFPRGENRVVWDGRGNDGKFLPSGVYLSRLQTADYTLSRKVTLVR